MHRVQNLRLWAEVLKLLDFVSSEHAMIPLRPLDENGLFGIDYSRAGALRVFRYWCLRELAKRLFRRN